MPLPSLHIVPSPQSACSTAWGAVLDLRYHPQNVDLTLDLTEINFVDPLFLVRLRGFIDRHCVAGCDVQVVSPRSIAACRYLERMHLLVEAPSRCRSTLGTRPHAGANGILIPIRRLYSPGDSDTLDQELEDLYLAHFTKAIAPLAGAFSDTIGEISENATTHGYSVDGAAYVAAQRYPGNRCVIAIGDLGVGIPAHVRGTQPGLKDDGDAIRVATKEGISGTGDKTRGFGFQEVIDALKEPEIGYGDLRIWSGGGRFRFHAQQGVQLVRRAWSVDAKTEGTWVRVELVA